MREVERKEERREWGREKGGRRRSKGEGESTVNCGYSKLIVHIMNTSSL